MFEQSLVVVASFFAGGIDAIVGGGGLILVPALFVAFPREAPATLLGTNKLAAIAGTTVSAARLLPRVVVEWRTLLPATALAFAGSLAGAWTLTLIDPSALRKALPVVLLALLIYTLAKKHFGEQNDPPTSAAVRMGIVSAVGVTIGFYDGLFGPGTGSLMIFLLVRFLRVDFLTASAVSKVLNVATNAAALLLLSARGAVWWQLGLWLALANIAGGLVGSYLALRLGSGLVKKVFIAVVAVLIVKTGVSAFA